MHLLELHQKQEQRLVPPERNGRKVALRQMASPTLSQQGHWEKRREAWYQTLHDRAVSACSASLNSVECAALLPSLYFCNILRRYKKDKQVVSALAHKTLEEDDGAADANL